MKELNVAEWQFHKIPKEEHRYAYHFEMLREFERFPAPENNKPQEDFYNKPWLEFRKSKETKDAYISSFGDWTEFPQKQKWPHYTIKPNSCVTHLSSSPYNLSIEDYQKITHRLWACEVSGDRTLELLEIDWHANLADIKTGIDGWIAKKRKKKKKPKKTSWEGQLADLVCYRIRELGGCSIQYYKEIIAKHKEQPFAYRKYNTHIYSGVKRVRELLNYRANAEYNDSLVSSRFSESELVNLPSLAVKLKQSNRAFDTWLAEELSPHTKEALIDYQGQSSDPNLLQQSLLQDLNKIIKSDSVFVESRFIGISLRQETKKLVSQYPPDSNLERLNRMLIEDAYPLEVAKKHSLDKDTKSKDPAEEKITLAMANYPKTYLKPLIDSSLDLIS